jgi:hypothetical protein
MDRWLGDFMSSGYEPAGIWNEYVLYTGTTTSDGNVGKTTLICNGLVGENDFLSGVVVRISSELLLSERRSAHRYYLE